MKPGETTAERILRQYGIRDESHLAFPSATYDGPGLAYGGTWGPSEREFPDTDPPEVHPDQASLL